MKSYTFRPKLWAVLLTLLLASGMSAAGIWQYQRGVQKQTMQADRARSSTAAVQALSADVRTPARGQSRRVSVQGRYLPELAVRLDNQPHQGHPGVHAWLPFEMQDGRRVVVDRGWLPLAADVALPPLDEQQIEGQWRSLPQPGMRLGKLATQCETPRPTRVTYPDLAQLRCLFGPTTLDGVLELDANMPGGFQRDWAKSGVNEIPPSRHFGYAAQWGLFAATLIALFIKINLKKKSAPHV